MEDKHPDVIIDQFAAKSENRLALRLAPFVSHDFPAGLLLSHDFGGSTRVQDAEHFAVMVQCYIDEFRRLVIVDSINASVAEQGDTGPEPIGAVSSRILSGEASKPLWDAINAIPKRKTKEAVYALGCKCQELEAALERALERISALEGE